MVRPSLKEKSQDEIIKSAGTQIMVSECCRSELLAMALTPHLLHPRAWPVSTPVSSGKQLSGVKSRTLNSHASTQIFHPGLPVEKNQFLLHPHTSLKEGKGIVKKRPVNKYYTHSAYLHSQGAKNKRRGKEEKIRFNQPM